MKKTTLSKILILAVFLIVFSSSLAIGFGYFGDLINTQNGSFHLGEWLTDGVAISTPQEFYDFATKLDSDSEDKYYLTENLDFTDFDWEYTSTLDNVVFRGTLEGNGFSISNLKIYTNDTNHNYFGLFARSDGGSINNIVFNNVELDMGSNALNYSSMRTGLLFGRVSDSSLTSITNIYLNNCGVRGSSVYGTGGLVGQVYGYDTTVNITNIKATNFKVFSTTYNVGGLIGYIYTSSSAANISNIDMDVEIYSDYYYTYGGGIIGKIRSGGILSINNAVIELSTQNTLETSVGYEEYAGRYLGGIVGYNLSSSSNISINNTIVTGELIPYTSNYYYYVGTLIGRDSGSYTGSNNFYSQVLFLESNGNTSYYPSSRNRGEMSTVVNYETLPDAIWWDDFSSNFDDSVWNQDSTGRLYLLD